MHRLHCEEVLQVARRGDLNGAALEQIMDESNQSARTFCDDPVDRFICVKEAHPRCLCNVVRQCRWSGATIESVITIPKNLPCRKSSRATGRIVKAVKKMWRRRWL